MRIRLAGAFVILTALLLPAFAQTAARVATFRDWSVYAYSGQAGRVCYIATRASRRTPDGLTRDPEYFMVANWPDRQAANEVSVIMGYPLEPNSTVTVAIDNETYDFFIGADTAWIRDLAQEEALVAAMRRGTSMTVTGRSRTGVETVDTYSLFGTTAALERSAQECR
jgi:hypothetical protein